MTDKACVFYYLRLCLPGFLELVRASQSGLKSKRFFRTNRGSRHVPNCVKNGLESGVVALFHGVNSCGEDLRGWKAAQQAFEVPEYFK